MVKYPQIAIYLVSHCYWFLIFVPVQIAMQNDFQVILNYNSVRVEATVRPLGLAIFLEWPLRSDVRLIEQPACQKENHVLFAFVQVIHTHNAPLPFRSIDGERERYQLLDQCCRLVTVFIKFREPLAVLHLIQETVTGLSPMYTNTFLFC